MASLVFSCTELPSLNRSRTYRWRASDDRVGILQSPRVSASSSLLYCRANARSGGVRGASGRSDGSEEDDVGSEVLNAAIQKSKKALGRQKHLLEQTVERRKAVTSTKDTVLDAGAGFVSSSDNVTSLSKQNSTVTTKVEDLNRSNNQILSKLRSKAEGESSVAEILGLSRESHIQTGPKAVQLPAKGAARQMTEDAFENATATKDRGGEGSSSEKKNMESPPLAGENVMNVIFTAAECAHWSKTGGLGDVASALPRALARRGHRVMVVVPRYGDYSEPQEIGECKHYRIDGEDMEVRYYHAYIDDVDFVFLDSPIFRHRENDIYGGERVDILKRMVLFCKAAVEVPWRVPCGGVCYGDGNLVFIANDWHTALLPVYLKAYYRDNGTMRYARSVLVIHNIAHQGRGPIEDIKYVDLPGQYHDLFKLHDPFGGKHFNIFAAGLKCADRIAAVSHGYLWELRTPEGGWGLHNIINENDWKLHGIVNGIDTNEWNPEVDIHLKTDGYINYTPKSFKSGKAQCKAALQRELGLPVREEVPLIGFIGRLDHQKGVDIIGEAIPWMVDQDMQLIMLGSGRPDLEEMLRKFEGQHHDKVRGWVGFSVKTAHRITAGSDILLMPSRFEPCGLNQLYAMKYGTIPVVHAVGGLRDTVLQFDPFAETGTGWTFDRAESNKLIDALGHCFNTYWNFKKSWEGLQRRGMSQDLSWDNAARQYEDVLAKAKYQW